MRWLIATLLLVATSQFSVAKSTICKIDSNVLGPKAIGWDISSGVAKYTDTFDKTHIGKVSFSREHNSGEKINLYFDFKRDYFGIMAAEFIVFPSSDGTYHVIGVGYVIVNGERLLTQLLGNYPAICVSL